MELDIAFFARLLGDDVAAEKFSAASQARHATIKSIFWNAKLDQWLDYWMPNNSTCKVAHSYIDIVLFLRIFWECLFLWCYKLYHFLKYSAFPNSSTRELTLGKGRIKIKTFLLRTLFLFGLTYSTQVGDSVFVFWHFLVNWFWLIWIPSVFWVIWLLC